MDLSDPVTQTAYDSIMVNQNIPYAAHEEGEAKGGLNNLRMSGGTWKTRVQVHMSSITLMKELAIFTSMAYPGFEPRSSGMDEDCSTNHAI